MNAFIGMGLLGSNFVKAMLKRNEPVQVWNRTETKAKALEAFGAKWFSNITDAVKGADYIHVTLKDDASVDTVLQSALAGLKSGAVIIDHTTTSVEGAIKRTQDWKNKGHNYIHTPVFMGPQNALEGTGFMLVSGDQALINSLEPFLSKMTGKLINFGVEDGKAAAIKLMGNLFLLTLTAGISDTLALAKGFNLSGADISTLFDAWNPGAAMPSRLKRIATGKFEEPSWELSMARKDAGLMMDAAKKSEINLAIIPTIAAEMDKWIAKGYGNHDWSVIAKDNVS